MKSSEVLAFPLRGWKGLRDGNRYETDFLPAALEITERPASPLGRGVAATLGAMTAIAIIWAAVGQVDIIATAPGKITPIGNSKIVQPLETSIVTAIKVADGDHVEADQVLVELDSTTARNDRDKYAQDLIKARLEISRLQGLREGIAGRPVGLIGVPAETSPEEVAATDAALRAQASEQSAKLAALDQQIRQKSAEEAETVASIDKLNGTLPIISAEAELRRQLHEKEYGNKIAWLEAEEKLIDAQRGLPVLQRHREESISARLTLQQQREQAEAEFEKTILSDLADAQQKASEFEKERDKAAQRLSQQTLRAPIAGIVQQLAVHTLGGVVTPAQSVLVIVPDGGGLIVEAHIQNKNVGFVRAGQDAQLKVETFNFTRYGLIAGKVLNVSRDAVTTPDENSRRRGNGGDAAKDEDQDQATDSGGYVARIALDHSEMVTEAGPVDLGPGMNVTAEIKTGRRSVISYLLSPVFRYRQESLRER